MDYYNVLGIPRDATREEIKYAYEVRARQPLNDDVKMTLSLAYRTLSDSASKVNYDLYLAQGFSGLPILDLVADPTPAVHLSSKVSHVQPRDRAESASNTSITERNEQLLSLYHAEIGRMQAQRDQKSGGIAKDFMYFLVFGSLSFFLVSLVCASAMVW